MKSDPYTLGSLNQISTLFTEPEKKMKLNTCMTEEKFTQGTNKHNQ